MEQKDKDSILTKCNEMIDGMTKAGAATTAEVKAFMDTPYKAVGSINGGEMTKVYIAKPGEMSAATLDKVFQYGWQRIHNDTSNDDLVKITAKHVALMTGQAITRGGPKREGWEQVAVERLLPLMDAETKKDAGKRSAFLKLNVPKLEEWAKAEHKRRQEADKGVDDVIAGILG